MCIEVISKGMTALELMHEAHKQDCGVPMAQSDLVLQTRHTGAQQGCLAWMLNLRPVGCFIQRYKQVQALLHALSRGASMGWIVKQYMEPPC